MLHFILLEKKSKQSDVLENPGWWWWWCFRNLHYRVSACTAMPHVGSRHDVVKVVIVRVQSVPARVGGTRRYAQDVKTGGVMPL